MTHNDLSIISLIKGFYTTVKTRLVSLNNFEQTCIFIFSQDFVYKMTE